MKHHADPRLGAEPPRERRVRRRLAAAAAAFLLGALVPGLAPGAARTAEADAGGCGPFGPETEVAAATGAPATEASPGSGPSGRELPAPAPSGPSAQDAAPERLLVLPRTPAGDLGEAELALGPDARIVDSFWSPLVCATVARVVGAPGSGPEELVAAAPSGAAVVPNDVYTSAAEPAAPADAPATAPAPARELPAEPSEPVAGAEDPYRSLQYALDALEVERARPLTDGRGVRVGLVDTRPAPDHPDLPAALRVGSDATGRAPGRHGTLLAGIVAASERNGLGIAGVAPGAELVALPACEPAAQADAPDRCRLFDLLQAFDAAWEARTAVLNISLVGPANPLLERAMERLGGLGVLVVAAAGNEGGETARYPAAYPSVIGVGALDATGARWARSHRGPAAELLAPGVEVVSTVPGGRFAFADGTSLAAAHVSGVLALLASASGETEAARTALFQAGQQHRDAESDAAVLAPVCDALERLGQACP